MKVTRMLWIGVLCVALAAPLRTDAAGSNAGEAAVPPPSQIGLRVMRLTPNGGNSGVPCDVSPDEKSFGCGASGYPYVTNPITVPIETDYLLNVVPHEMPLSFDVAAIEAQATAARSFTYWYARRGTLINNSISYQAFIPGKFASVGVIPDNPVDPCSSGNLGARQAKLCAAMANPRYMTRFDSEIPVFAQYSADWPDRTMTNRYHKALQAVDDPISNTTNGVCNSDGTGSHGHGLSQNGANRWARGYQCAYSARAPWSVAWGTAERILFHYYTGIHLRAAAPPQRERGLLERLLSLFADEAIAQPGEIVSPEWRWNPLRIDGAPAQLSPNGAFALDVQLQNTGVYTWTCAAGAGCFSLGYVWSGAPGQVYTSTAWAALPCSVAPGDPSVRTSLNVADRPAWPSGAYTLTLDVRAHTADGRTIWFGEQGWPAYQIPITLTDGGIEGRTIAGTSVAFVPLVQNAAATAPEPSATAPELTATAPEPSATPEPTADDGRQPTATPEPTITPPQVISCIGG